MRSNDKRKDIFNIFMSLLEFFDFIFQITLCAIFDEDDSTNCSVIIDSWDQVSNQIVTLFIGNNKCGSDTDSEFIKQFLSGRAVSVSTFVFNAFN